MFAKRFFYVCAGLLCLAPTEVFAAKQVGVEFFPPSTTLINFDVAPDGAPLPSGHVLDATYAAFGIYFGAEDGVTDWAGIPVSLPNRCWGSSDGLSPIDCSFPSGVSAVGAYGFDFVLEAFDRDGGLILRVGHTDGTPGLYGGSQELGFLGISSPSKLIHLARFSRYWSEQASFGFEIDDLRFRSRGRAFPQD
jgi:hypothetical protein